jgi:hypothetical protein
VASLRELQDAFATALRDPAAQCAVLPAANMDVYRNNASFTFRETLARTFPVVRRRVGDDYFHQLAATYRARFPSRSGDLHGFGREFPGFLAEYLDADYTWLADLARLEWLRAESEVAETAPALGADALGAYAPADLERLAFAFQPSLRLHSSSYPVFTVWQANQIDDAPPVDQSLGSEAGMILSGYDAREVQPLSPRLFSFLSALHDGATLGEAMTVVAFEEHELLDALAFMFRHGLVRALSLRLPT